MTAVLTHLRLPLSRLAIASAIGAILVLLALRKRAREWAAWDAEVMETEEDMYVPMTAWTWPDDTYQYGVSLNVRNLQ